MIEINENERWLIDLEPEYKHFEMLISGMNVNEALDKIEKLGDDIIALYDDDEDEDNV